MNLPKLLKFILSLDIGNGSKEAFLFTVSKYLSIHDKTNIHIDKFVREGKKLMLKTKEADGDNLVDIQHADSYQSYDYFLKIITTKDYKNINNIVEHNQHLLLSLLFLNPPLRTSYYSTAILTKKIEYKQNDTNNYLLLKHNLGSDRAYIVINKDKVSNSRSFSDPIKSTIEIINKDLVALLYWSFEKFKRRYLFESDKKTKVSDDTIRNYLRRASKLKNINIDIVRSIYITHRYNTDTKTANQRQELAIKMRHDQKTAAASYYKIISRDDTASKNENEVIKELKQTIEALNIQINDLKSKLEEVTPAEDSKLFLKRKSDIQARLKAGKNVKPDTIQKYGINKDSITVKK